MADSIVLAVFVEVGFVRGRFQVEILGEKLAKIDATILRLGKDFNAIAGAENHSLADARDAEKLLQSVGQTALGDGEALADLDGGRFVVHADKLKIHGLASAWMVLK
jgi:hypothetical protein